MNAQIIQFPLSLPNLRDPFRVTHKAKTKMKKQKRNQPYSLKAKDVIDVLAKHDALGHRQNVHTLIGLLDVDVIERSARQGLTTEIQKELAQQMIATQLKAKGIIDNG